jgi:hypothetical protein
MTNDAFYCPKQGGFLPKGFGVQNTEGVHKNQKKSKKSKAFRASHSKGFFYTKILRGYQPQQFSSLSIYALLLPALFEHGKNTNLWSKESHPISK